MILAITTTTTTTTTTATAIGVSQAAIYGALGVVILIVLLTAKELLGSYGDEGEATEEAKGDFTAAHIKAKLLATNLNSAIYPLLFCFSLIVVMKVLEVL